MPRGAIMLTVEGYICLLHAKSSTRNRLTGADRRGLVGPQRLILKEELRMKKVLSLVLAFAMILGSFGFVFASDFSDVKDTEYYIVAEEDLAKFKGGDKSVAFGKGDGEALLKGGPAFVGPAEDGAAKYNLTMNMEKQAIVIEPEIHFYCYYLYANSAKKMNPADGETSRNYMFYKSDETTFTYTTMWPNDDNGKSVYNVKVWEREDMLANLATNTWGFDGTAKGTRKEQGNFAQPGQWLGPLTEGWYTFTITMDEENNKHSYKWTSIPAPTTTYTNISIIGTINGSNRDKDFELKQCAKAPHNWCLLDFELTAEAKLKFRANNNWDTKDWGGDGSQPISPVVYTLPKGSTDITVPAGKYDFYLNDITGDWTILKAVE